jgi:transcriptional regulator with XRE-family HTH domain
LLELTQQQLAEAVGVKRLTIIRWEQDDRRDIVSNPSALAAIGKIEPFVEARLHGAFALSHATRANESLKEPELSASERVELEEWLPTTEQQQIRENNTIRGVTAVFVRGGYAALSPALWEYALGIDASILKDVPRAERSDRELVWGYDVGYAIDALLKGKGYDAAVTAELRTNALAARSVEQLIVALARHHLFEEIRMADTVAALRERQAREAVPAPRPKRARRRKDS